MNWTEQEYEDWLKRRENKKQAAIPAAKESEIQRQIKEYLQWQGWFVVKIHQSLGSYKGIADLYALKDGCHIWIEVKTEKGELSECQREFRDEIRKHGGKYIMVRGIEDLKQVEEKFNGQEEWIDAKTL